MIWAGIGSATIGTLIVVAVIVAALALYLIAIAVTLTRVSFILGTVLIGVRAIANQTAPVGSVIRDIYGDVSAIQGALDGLLEGVSMKALSSGRTRARR